MDATTIRVTKALHNVGTQELAERAGVSRMTAWRWQSGQPYVAPETAARLERALFNSGTGTDAREKVSA